MSSSSIEPKAMGSSGMMEVIAPGVFGTSVVLNGKPIHLRMELLTRENEERWTLFKSLTSRLSGASRGALTCLVGEVCEDGGDITHLNWVQYTGFSEEEHEAFLQKIRNAKERTDGKIYDLITKADGGSGHMCTYSKDSNDVNETSNLIHKNGRYIIYASRNPEFTIPHVKSPPDHTLKNWIVSYKDILICAGTDFSYDETLFHTRGIFRNPYWVLKGKYSGLSMLLHGFSGMIANTYFPKKERLVVVPLGSMMCIFQKSLQSGEATYQVDSTTSPVDALALKVKPRSGQRGTVLIAVSALVRIFNASISREAS